jgi:2-methylisocitrate lyase-like PEP mutase family enzyme
MTDRHAAYPTGLKDTPTRHRALRRRMEAPGIVVAPGAYDCITARLVEVSGFDACYITGSGVSMSALGAPDMGALSFGEILDRVRRICDSVSIPVIADADTGYGGPLNVIRTMREFERAGVSAVQLEDQEWPKKCGHEPGRKVASSQEMEQRIRAAADARVDQDVMIVARTDAIASEGFEAALERAARYREAGADILFVEAPPSEADLAQVPKRLGAPCLANMVEGGRTPVLPLPKLEQLGFKLAIYPNSLTRLFARVGQDLLGSLKTTGNTAAMANQMLDHGQLWSLFENERWQALEKRFSSS